MCRDVLNCSRVRKYQPFTVRPTPLSLAEARAKPQRFPSAGGIGVCACGACVCVCVRAWGRESSCFRNSHTLPRPLINNPSLIYFQCRACDSCSVDVLQLCGSRAQLKLREASACVWICFGSFCRTAASPALHLSVLIGGGRPFATKGSHR